MNMPEQQLETAVFGGGCFWCLEAVFELVPGVLRVENGYAGGKNPAPTYEQVCSGTTGHIEVVRLSFDSQRVSYQQLLQVFFSAHDPHSMDKQGADTGSQYRSAVFWVDQTQQASLHAIIGQIAAQTSRKVVTESRPLADFPFWPAEEYHQHYFANHPDQAYCRIVIRPKVAHYLEHPVA